MTRVLPTQTASVRRVRAKALRILSGELYPEPALTILCAPDPETVNYFRQLPGAEVVPLQHGDRQRILADLRQRVMGNTLTWLLQTSGPSGGFFENHPGTDDRIQRIHDLP